MAAIDTLKNLLNEDIRQLDELAELLKLEKQKLAESDVQSLEALTAKKNALLQMVRERAKQKIHALVDMGFRPDNGQPTQFIQSSGLADLIESWSSAEQRLRECKRLNQVNERVVGNLQKRLARLSDIFRGTTGHQKLYGASGHQTTVTQTTVLASA
ncbi:flagella synthesis protein FlgN [Marinobacter zhejiangensis]|uniref:Flagella synthesis protein FlgN n=1 Tax=Marinobacter zhejiangensis TaxID=488535 RepID=A0A1I4PBN0_9GAMM|nr:flagellar protein FlgN [Marinobacter zhejiangensis]SFM25192.1 flagella synthesis protein FlgN [Marinobacter zhejiangensis]